MAVLSRVTPEQWGMVTAAQARALGVSRLDVTRLVADGVLEHVEGAGRVYRLAGSVPDPERDPLRAAWLQLGDERPATARLRDPDAVAAGRSAALAQGFGDLLADAHEFYVTRRRQLRRADLRLRVRSLPRAAWQVVDGLPVCTAEWVVADLLAEGEDESAVARICQDAGRAGQLNRDRLVEVVTPYVARYRGGSGPAFVDRLLAVNPGRGV